MTTLLQVHFSFEGPFGHDMSDALQDLAESINQEPGFISKIWTENQEQKEAGGIYLFEDKASAQAYLDMHSARLKKFGVQKVHAKFFNVNKKLSHINKGL
ncbi:monooxygenase [Vibrio algivorus]|uniref:Monooxygenase n=1 Tax=Vibrio algivorus TaxID=1667024 RepID=A0ABQ6ELS1_9VIBR|nr:monooxygenase [Vibrio algivorus]GLT14078.1 monooxygenase [Vibrio algivorus]